MLRWSLRYARWWGVARIGDDDLVVNPGQNDYEVSLRACKAFTKHGHIIEVSRGGEVLSLQGSNKDHSADTRVPIYVESPLKTGILRRRLAIRRDRPTLPAAIALKLAHQPNRRIRVAADRSNVESRHTVTLDPAIFRTVCISTATRHETDYERHRIRGTGRDFGD